MPPIVQEFGDREAMSVAAAAFFAEQAREAVAARGRFLTALSGGGTPQPTFERLGTAPFRDSIPWAKTDIFWSDERLVPPDHDGSNYRQAYDAFLHRLPIPTPQIHRARGEREPARAVADYIRQLRELAYPARDGWPIFDLILLGMGSDGHTASLFPGPLPAEAARQPVIAVTADYDGRPAHRLTFTPPLINAARHILFLVAGAAKQQALHAVLHGPHNPTQWPAQRVQPEHGSVTWMVVPHD